MKERLKLIRVTTELSPRLENPQTPAPSITSRINRPPSANLPRGFIIKIRRYAVGQGGWKSTATI